MNLNYAVALEPAPITVGLTAAKAALALAKLARGNSLTESELSGLREALELLHDLAFLAHLGQGTLADFVRKTELPVGLFWLLEPARAVGARLGELPDRWSRFFELLHLRLSAALLRVEKRREVVREDVELLERFFSELSEEMLHLANQQRVAAGDDE